MQYIHKENYHTLNIYNNLGGYVFVKKDQKKSQDINKQVHIKVEDFNE